MKEEIFSYIVFNYKKYERIKNMTQLSTKNVTEEYLPNTILRAFKKKYATVFERYDKYYKNIVRIGYDCEKKPNQISLFDAIMDIASQVYSKDSATCYQDVGNFCNLFSCMYYWDKSKIAYNYPKEELRAVGNIDNLHFKAQYFIEMPFHSFYIEGYKEWENVHGILVNIVETPEFYGLSEITKRTFQVDAIVLCEDDSFETLNMNEACISFYITEDDTYGSFYPNYGEDCWTCDYIEGRNGELRYQILRMCYFLYKISHERNSIPTIGKAQNKGTIPNGDVESWDTEHRIVYDDLDPKEKKILKEKVAKEENNVDEKVTEEKKKRKSPRPHYRAGTEGYRWCGSGENKHLEKRWIKGSFPNGNKGNAAIPVVEHRKKRE